MRGAAWAGLLAIAAWGSCLLIPPPAACGDGLGRPGESREVSEEDSEEPEFVDFHEITAKLTRRWGLATDPSDSTVMPGIRTIRRREGETATSYVDRIRKAQQALEARVRALPPEGVPFTVECDWRLPLYQSSWEMFVLSMGPMRGGRLLCATGEPFVKPWHLLAKPDCGRVLVSERTMTFTYCVPPDEAGRLTGSPDSNEVRIRIHLRVSPRDDKLAYIVGTPSRKDWEAGVNAILVQPGPAPGAEEQLFFKPSFAIESAELFAGKRRLATFMP